MDVLNRAEPSVSPTISHFDSIERLLQQTVQAIATAYQADCVLWVGLDDPSEHSLRVYSIRSGQQKSVDDPVQPLEQLPTPTVLPQWVLEQRRSPHLTQLASGELVVPVVWQPSFEQPDHPATSGSLQLLLQLGRVELPADPITSTSRLPGASGSQEILAPADPLSTGLPAAVYPSPTTPTVLWSADDLTALATQSQQLGLLYSALYGQQQRLHQLRQQVALLGRTTQLLNSSLDADEMVEQIIAELGQGLGCDRCLLIRLHERQANVMSYWDTPEQKLPPVNPDAIEQAPWQVVEEAFLQEGASYLQVTPVKSRSALSIDAETDAALATDPEPELDSLQGWLNNLGATSALVIPIFVQTEFVGIVGLLSYQPVDTYRLEDLQTARQVADHVAIALTNAQHYQHLWHRHDALRLQNPTLQQQALRDELTQLLNRKALDRELDHLSNRALWTVQSPFSIIFCDLDYFKLINDTHGYQTGDIVLQKLAQRFQKQLRQETSAYRYDGEEFVVLLTETTSNHALDVAERLRQVIQTSPVETPSGSISVTASFGIAQQDSSRDRDAYSVLHRAEQALREAKCHGRDCVKML